MLVLTRKKSELIQIGEGIVIKIISTGAKTVKIGIEAPKEVRVLRGELCTDLNVGPLAQFLAEKPLAATKTDSVGMATVAVNHFPLARAS
jgi:carbon storage regulator